jgi:hypothetical protein
MPSDVNTELNAELRNLRRRARLTLTRRISR